MNWQLVILLQTALVGASIITMRVLARDEVTARASFVINAGMYVALYATMLLLVPFFGHIDTQVASHYWWRIVGGGIAFALTNVFMYKTLVYFDAAIATIAGSVKALFAIVGAALFLSEDLTLLQICGAAALLAGITYGVLATHTTSKKTIRRSVMMGAMFALLGGVAYGVAMVNEKSLLMHMPMATYIVYGVGGQCIVMLLSAVAVQRKQLGLLLRPHVAGWAGLSGILRGLGGGSFIFCEVRSNNVGLISAIANFRIIIVILLGAWLLKEHQHLRQKFAAAAAAIAGLTIMFWK